jgi:hypothetical protein
MLLEPIVTYVESSSESHAFTFVVAYVESSSESHAFTFVVTYAGRVRVRSSDDFAYVEP